MLALEFARRGNIDVDGVFDRLPFDAVSVKSREHVDWDDFATFIDRLAERAGGPNALEPLLTGSLLLPELRYLMSTLLSPVALCRVMHEVVMPAAFTACCFAFKALAPNHFHVKLSLRPGARPSLTWFTSYGFALSAMPQYLGLAPAKVASTLSATAGCYDMRLESAHDSSAAFDTPDDSVWPQLLHTRLTEAVARWRLTRRQSCVLTHLVRGAGNKETAAALACAENTIEFHVTQLLKKANASSRTQLIAMFWAGQSFDIKH